MPSASSRFFRDADLVIFDAMYSLADAISVKADWGHSSNIVGVELCQHGGRRATCACSTTSRCSTTRRSTPCWRRRAASRKSRAAASRLHVSAAFDGMEIAL